MSWQDLLNHPLWQPNDLGRALPDSVHAVSMVLPRWDDVVGYEEKAPRVINKLECGYPRFVIHPLVAELAAQLAPGQPALPWPSRRTAELAATYVRQLGEPAELVQGKQPSWAVVTSQPGLLALRAFWQHTGLIVSSRHAQALLAQQPTVADAQEVRRSLRRKLALLYDVAETDVFLCPTGMAAQYAALRTLAARRPGLPTVQLGFPYVDTLKLQQKFGAGATLLHDLEHVDKELRLLLEQRHWAGAFAEVPGNPLLGSANLQRITPLLRARRIPLVADDVVATPMNIDLAPYADLVATSLTKYIVGTGEAMGGALICNRRSPYYHELKPLAAAQHEELLWPEDARVIDTHAAGFADRMRQHNRGGLFLAEKIRAHPAIEQVWYPKWEFNEAYEAVRRPQGGYGSLITFLPVDAPRKAPAIYDQLPCCKGPSLGTAFTLVCPFTLLAHYTELDWAEACGVSRHLIRISVGIEDPAELWARIEPALRLGVTQTPTGKSSSN